MLGLQRQRWNYNRELCHPFCHRGNGHRCLGGVSDEEGVACC